MRYQRPLFRQPRSSDLVPFIGLFASFVAFLAVVCGAIAAYATHVIACIKLHMWLLLIIGVVVPPVGLIHGIAIWFGWL